MRMLLSIGPLLVGLLYGCAEDTDDEDDVVPDPTQTSDPSMTGNGESAGNSIEKCVETCISDAADCAGACTGDGNCSDTCDNIFESCEQECEQIGE